MTIDAEPKNMFKVININKEMREQLLNLQRKQLNFKSTDSRFKKNDSHLKSLSRITTEVKCEHKKRKWGWWCTTVALTNRTENEQWKLWVCAGPERGKKKKKKKTLKKMRTLNLRLNLYLRNEMRKWTMIAKRTSLRYWLGEITKTRTSQHFIFQNSSDAHFYFRLQSELIYNNVIIIGF